MALRPVYSVQLLSLHPALPSQSVVVPTGSRLILRDIDAFEVGGTAGAALSIHNAADGLLWNVVTTTPWTGVNQQWRGRQVYNPGEVIRVSITGGTWDIQMSGYELTVV